MSTLGEHTAKNPVDLSRLDGITDPQVHRDTAKRSLVTA
jgi:hypothetical protein